MLRRGADKLGVSEVETAKDELNVSRLRHGDAEEPVV